MIKVICLDMGKVIIDYDPTIPLASLGARSQLSLPEIKQVLTDREPLLLFDRGHYSRSDFYRTMCAPPAAGCLNRGVRTALDIPVPARATAGGVLSAQPQAPLPAPDALQRE